MTGTDRTKFMGKTYKRVTDMTETDKTQFTGNKYRHD